MWNTIQANRNLIQAQTDKAVLIKLPKTDWMFWHPAKCVRLEGKGGYLLKISYTSEFKIKLFRQGKGWDKKILAEKIVSGDELQALFN